MHANNLLKQKGCVWWCETDLLKYWVLTTCTESVVENHCRDFNTCSSEPLIVGLERWRAPCMHILVRNHSTFKIIMGGYTFTFFAFHINKTTHVEKEVGAFSRNPPRYASEYTLREFTSSLLSEAFPIGCNYSWVYLSLITGVIHGCTELPKGVLHLMCCMHSYLKIMLLRNYYLYTV